MFISPDIQWPLVQKFAARMSAMWIGQRIELTAPQWRAEDFRQVCWRVWAGHSGDEYGNCSIYVITALAGGIVIFPGLHFQRDIEMPEPGEHPWIDRKFYGRSGWNYVASLSHLNIFRSRQRTGRGLVR